MFVVCCLHRDLAESEDIWNKPNYIFMSSNDDVVTEEDKMVYIRQIDENYSSSKIILVCN